MDGELSSVLRDGEAAQAHSGYRGGRGSQGPSVQRCLSLLPDAS